MTKKEGQFFKKEKQKVEILERGIHNWFSRPDITESEDLVVVEVDMKAGGGHPFHIHPTMDEVIYIISGEAEHWIEKESKILQKGEAVYTQENDSCHL